MRTNYYVYAHRKASDGFVFYIGKGTGKRAWSSFQRNEKWKKTVEVNGFWVDMIRENMPQCCALSLESATIFATGKRYLCNIMNGGIGRNGWSHSEEARAKISAANKGKSITEKARLALRINDGRPMSEEQKRKLSLRKKGIKLGPPSEETKRKISQSHMGLRPSKETLLKMSASKMGKKRGRENPTYDHKIREFYKDNGDIFIGTRADFIDTFLLRPGCVSSIITGKQRSVKGWRLR